MKSGITFILIILFIAIILFFSSFYTVQEGQRALKLRLGKIVMQPNNGKAEVIQPGLHFKWPFITTVKKFDVRLRNLDVEASRILTAEQKYVLVDYYAKWRINDLPLYFTRTRGFTGQAEQLLKQKINNALRAAFGERDIKEVISGERLNIMKMLKRRANQSAESLGLSVIDVRIQGIDLPTQVRDSVYQRMRTQREQVATKFRAEGRAQAEIIRANADRKVAIEIAKARTQAQQIRAMGDIKAADIYNAAYAKNPDFYAFYRSLLAYPQVFNQSNTVMVLKPNSRFFKYFKAL